MVAEGVGGAGARNWRKPAARVALRILTALTIGRTVMMRLIMWLLILDEMGMLERIAE